MYMMHCLGVNPAYVLWADITMHASSTLDLLNDAVMKQTQTFMLDCVHTEADSVTAVYIANMFDEVISKHNLVGKACAFVTDTPSTNKVAWRLVEQRHPKVLSVGCWMHILDLYLHAFQPRTQTTAMPNSVITSDCEVEEEDCEIEEVDCGDDMSIGQFNLLPPIDIATARLAAARINAASTQAKDKSQLRTSYQMFEDVLDNGTYADGEVASKEVMAALRLFLRKRPVTVEERCSHLYECYMKMPKVLCMVLCTLATGYRKSKDGGECNADSLRQRIFSLARTVRGEHHRVKISENDMAPILPMSRHAAAAPAAYGGPPPTPGPGSWPMSGHAAEAPLAYGGPPPTPGPGSWPMSGHAAEAPAAYGGPPPTPGPGSWPGVWHTASWGPAPSTWQAAWHPAITAHAAGAIDPGIAQGFEEFRASEAASKAAKMKLLAASLYITGEVRIFIFP
ncbi:hypothetical protein QJQ45_012221 [Haematococcus lacustris]|nr:hypothetical protein QJQ45_012221 [Haematococcus lacustris]